MKFTEIDHGFCESIGQKLPYPEIFNFYSSFYISFIGLLGMILNYYNGYRFRVTSLIYGMFFINGFGAAGYHYTQQKGWSVIDELSMMIAINLGLLYLYGLLIKQNKKYFELNKIYGILNILLTCYISIYLILGFTFSIFDETRYLFPLIFMFSCLSLIPGLIIMFKFTKDSNYYNDYRRVLIIGLITSILSGFLWVITENLCPLYPILKYTYSHSIWHIGMSYGMFMIMQFVIYYTLHYKTNKKPIVRIYCFIPIIKNIEKKY